MKLKISLANTEETQCMKNQESVLIDRLLNTILNDKKFEFPNACIKRTDELNIVEVGDFATNSSDQLEKPELYGIALLNLTFGLNYNIEEVK
jgi:hypothetical protein